MSSAELTSPATARAWPPAAVISSAMVRTRSPFRPVNATIRPPFAKRRATAAPSPAEAPTPTIHATPGCPSVAGDRSLDPVSLAITEKYRIRPDPPTKFWVSAHAVVRIQRPCSAHPGPGELSRLRDAVPAAARCVATFCRPKGVSPQSCVPVLIPRASPHPACQSTSHVPVDVLRRWAPGIIFKNFPVPGRNPRQRQNERPVADDQGGGAVFARRHQRPKRICARNGLFQCFSGFRPPLLRQMSELVMRKSICKHCRVASDIAYKRGPFANLMHDMHRNLMNGEDGLRGLQCARVGRNDDPRQRDFRQLRRSLGRLLGPQRRQFRILDPRIDASLVEVQIEVALPMPKQKHRDP